MGVSLPSAAKPAAFSTIMFVVAISMEKGAEMEPNYREMVTNDASGFDVLADYVPGILQEIRYYSTYNFICDRIDGFEEPCALITQEAARALQSVAGEMGATG